MILQITVPSVKFCGDILLVLLSIIEYYSDVSAEQKMLFVTVKQRIHREYKVSVF